MGDAVRSDLKATICQEILLHKSPQSEQEQSESMYLGARFQKGLETCCACFRVRHGIKVRTGSRDPSFKITFFQLLPDEPSLM